MGPHLNTQDLQSGMAVAFVVGGLTFINVGGIMVNLNNIVAKACATSKRVWERSTSASVGRQMNVPHRLAAMLVVIACSIGLASQVSAVSLTTSSSEFLGITPGEPSSPANEVVYINFLTALAPGTTIAGPSSPPDYQRSSNILCFPACPLATEPAVDVTGNTGDFGSGFYYLLGKYDGPNLGDVIWYVAGLTGSFEIPTCVTKVGGDTCYGLSHAALFNASDGHASPTDTVPEPSTLLLFGAGLIAMSRFARKSK
jgi:hypothetical protein